MKMSKNTLPRAMIIFLIFTVLCGAAYTGAVTGLAQAFFSDKANGSIIEVDGVKYGSSLLAQQYTDDAYLWGRIMKLDVFAYHCDIHTFLPRFDPLYHLLPFRHLTRAGIDPQLSANDPRKL